jgi:hypothetical protein
MRLRGFVDTLSRFAPAIVVVTLLVALVGKWASAPAWMFYAMAAIVALLARILWSRRGVGRQLKSSRELGFASYWQRVRFDFAGKGTPRGYNWLGFLILISVFLLGFRDEYAVVTLALIALTVAWAEDRLRYPAEDGFKR